MVSPRSIGGLAAWLLGCAVAPALAAADARDAAALYRDHCAVCHGAQGDGKSRVAGSLSTAPPDLTSAEARRVLSRDSIAAVIARGRPGTAMVAWRSQLSDKDIARLSDFVFTRFVMGQAGTRSSPATAGARANGGREVDATSTPVRVDMTTDLPNGLKGDFKRGGAFYLANCATCHGARGDGAGPRAYLISPKPRSFIADAARARLNRGALYAGASDGKAGTAMPAWSKVATPQQLADVSEYVFQSFVLGNPATPAATATPR